MSISFGCLFTIFDDKLLQDIWLWRNGEYVGQDE